MAFFTSSRAKSGEADSSDCGDSNARFLLGFDRNHGTCVSPSFFAAWGFGCSFRGISSALYDLVPNGPAATQPETPPTLEKPLQPEEVRRQLTENEAQRKEVTGYINQLSIQLHRWQLRLQKLDERHKELEKELASPGT